MADIVTYLREKAPLHSSKESLVQDAIKKLGIPRKTIIKKMWEISITKSPLTFSTTSANILDKKSPLKGLSEAEMREKHDMRFIICNIVKKLERGTYIPDADFIKQCNIRSHVGYRQVLEDPEFRTYKGKVNGIVYWSHPDSIAKMKEEGILS